MNLFSRRKPMCQKLVICTCILLYFGCSSQNKIRDTSLQIKYEARTRGVSKVIVYQKGTIQSDRNGEKKTFILDKDQINQIHDALKLIRLKTMNTLESPTDKRYTDGALFATFSIQTSDGNYTSREFDDGLPPDELRPLFELLKKFSQ